MQLRLRIHLIAAMKDVLDDTVLNQNDAGTIMGYDTRDGLQDKFSDLPDIKRLVQ